MSVTATVYDSANAVEITAGGLSDAHGIRWDHMLRQTGMGQLVLQADDPQLTDADVTDATPRVVRCAIDGTVVFAWLIEGMTVRSVDRKEVDQVAEIRGRGTIARWEDFGVYPEVGVPSESISDTRTFNPSSKYFDDSTWTAAVQIEQGIGDPGSPREGYPVGLPDEALSAWWIQSQANDVNGSVPAGDQHYRRVYTSTGVLARLVITADNNHELWLDGELLEVDSVFSSGGVGWAGVKMLDRWLAPGDHVFYVKVHNVAGTDPNPSGFIFAAIELLDAGSTFGPTLLVSDSSWKALGYPASPPGFTPRRVLEILLTEAQARGAVPELTLGATNTADADGTPWPVSPDIAFRVGLDGLSVIRQLCETYIDGHMDPTTMRLDVWVKGGKGTASGVEWSRAEGNVTEQTHEAARPFATSYLVRWQGGWIETVGAGDRVEKHLSQGAAPTADEANRVATSLLSIMGVQSETISLTIEPAGGDEPYVDINLGDTVTVADRHGALVTRRYVGVTVSTDAQGNPYYVPELEAS